MSIAGALVGLLCGIQCSGGEAPTGTGAAVGDGREAGLEFGNGLRIAEWGGFGYQVAPGPKTSGFNLDFVLRRDSRAKSPRARVIFNVVDEGNYYFAEFGLDSVRLGRVESGVEQPIGTVGGFGLSRGAALKATLKRRPFSMTVVLDGEVVARAFDDTFSGGGLGGGAIDGSVAIEGVRVQPVGSLYFADDFMRASGDTGGWEPVSGEWDVYALDNPTRSVNAFSYVGRSARNRALAVAGHRFWDNYRFTVSAKSKGAGWLGVVFGYVDRENHYRLVWASCDTGEAKRKVRLLRVHDGKEQVLAERPTPGYRFEQWYVIEIEALDGRVRAKIDDTSLFDVRDSRSHGGRIGLCTKSEGETFFDDVVVARAKDFLDDFSMSSRGTWTALGGEWLMSSEAGDGAEDEPSFRVDAGTDARVVCGQPTWRRYTLGTEIDPWASGLVGMVFAYLDETRYGLVRLRSAPKPEAELVYVTDGKEKSLARAPLAGLGERVVRAAVSVDDGIVSVTVDGDRVLEAWEPSAASGRVGLYASNSRAGFRKAEVSFAHERVEPVFTANQIFAAETYMAGWAAAQNDWHTTKEQTGGTEQEVWWHQVTFPGDTDIWIALEQAAAGKGELSVALAAAEERLATGYEVALTGGDGWTAKLRRLGNEVAQGKVPAGTSLGLLRVRRSGALIIVYLGEVPVIAWRDAKPLGGWRLGYWASGLAVRNESIEVFCDDVLVDNFTQAATEWRAGHGLWTVSKRWQCDPRWSFFSGACDDGPAALWHKRAFAGDLTLEFAAAVQMDYSRGFGYSYASDLNATICADGQDLDSGYSFVLGGWKNKKTAIVRGTKVVAETDKPVIDGGIHYRWWLFRIEKRGGTLRYYLDNNLLLEYTDPEPLNGDRVAVWTYCNGMMLARFRISCAGEKALESPERTAEPGLKCFYDALAP